MITAFASCIEVPSLRFILRQEPLFVALGHNTGSPGSGSGSSARWSMAVSAAGR
jgi:hypothetical protein